MFKKSDKKSREGGSGRMKSTFRLRCGLRRLIDKSLAEGVGLKQAVVDACKQRAEQAPTDLDNEDVSDQSEEEAEINQPPPQKKEKRKAVKRRQKADPGDPSFLERDILPEVSSTGRRIKRRAEYVQYMKTNDKNPHRRESHVRTNSRALMEEEEMVEEMEEEMENGSGGDVDDEMDDEEGETDEEESEEDSEEDGIRSEDDDQMLEEEGGIDVLSEQVEEDNEMEDADAIITREPKKPRLDIQEKDSPISIMQSTKSKGRPESLNASTSTLSTGSTLASGTPKKTDMLTGEENEDVHHHEEQNVLMEDISEDRNDTIAMDDTAGSSQHDEASVKKSLRRSGRRPRPPLMASKTAGSRRLTKNDTSTSSRATLDDPLRLGHFEGVKLFEKPGEFNAKYQTWATYGEALERVRAAKENVIPELLTDRDIVAEVYEKDGEGAEKWDKLTEEKVKNGQERFEVDYIVGCSKRELGSEQFDEILMKYAEYPRSSFENKKDHEGERALLKFIYDQFRLDLIELRLLSEMGREKFDRDFPNRYLETEDGEGEGNYITQERNLYQNRLRALQHAYNYALQKAGIDADVLIADWTSEINKDDELKRVEFIAQMIPGVCIGDFLKDEKAEEIKCGPGECKSCVYLPTSKAPKKCCGVLSMQAIDKKTGKMQFLDKPADAQKNSSKESASVAPLVDGPFMKVECTSKCGCDPKKCKNRDSQVGRKYSHVIFRMPGKGWTLRTVDEIERNDSGIVGEYGGVAQLRKSTGDAKRYDLAMNSALDKKKPFTVAAAKCGNETRYISHSCVCNLHLIMAMVQRNGPWYTVPLFYPKRKIFAGEELTFDYMESIPEYDHTVFFDYCLCGYDACRYPRISTSKMTESVSASATIDEAGPSRIIRTLSKDRREGEQSGATDNNTAADEHSNGAHYGAGDDLNNGENLDSGNLSASAGSSSSTSNSANAVIGEADEMGTKEVKQEDDQDKRYLESMLPSVGTVERPEMSEGDASENDEDDNNVQIGAKPAELLEQTPLAGEGESTGTSGDNNEPVDDDHVEQLEIANISVLPSEAATTVQPTENNESSISAASSYNAAKDVADGAAGTVLTNNASTPSVPTKNTDAAAGSNSRGVAIRTLTDAQCTSAGGSSSTGERREESADDAALRESLFNEYRIIMRRRMNWTAPVPGADEMVQELKRNEIDMFIEVTQRQLFDSNPVSILERRVAFLR